MTTRPAPWPPHLYTWEIHPAALLFPEMGKADLKALIADVQANGVRQPIVFHDGKLLDGRNRVRAASAAGIVLETLPRRTLRANEDPYAFAWAANCMRLDYEPRMKAAIRLKVVRASGEFARRQGETAAQANRARAEKLEERRGDGGKAMPATSGASREAPLGRDRSGDEAKKTAAVLAKEAQVSRATMERVMKLERESPEAFEAVAAGKKPKAAGLRRPKPVEPPTTWASVPRAVPALAAFLKGVYSRAECERLADLLRE